MKDDFTKVYTVSNEGMIIYELSVFGVTRKEKHKLDRYTQGDEVITVRYGTFWGSAQFGKVGRDVFISKADAIKRAAARRRSAVKTLYRKIKRLEEFDASELE